jgi:hypothetical protein
MELTLALVITILNCVIGVSNFVLGRKDKSNKDTQDNSYKQGVIETKLDNLTKQVDKILGLLDGYEVEVKKQIDEALLHHVKEYHKEK